MRRKHEVIKEHHEKIRKDEKTVRVTLIVAIVVIAVIGILGTILMTTDWEATLGFKKPEELVTEKLTGEVAQCVSDNPWISEEQCWDLNYHDEAISENNPDICEQIEGEKIKQHCKDYFG